MSVNDTSRRTCLKTLAAGAAGVGLAPGWSVAAPHPTYRDTQGLLKKGRKIPVIYDSDLGDDIDDTWALVMLLQSPELDVKLVLADYQNATYRAKLMAKLLTVAGRTDIPVGIGIHKADKTGRQSAWLGDYKLDQYKGTVHQDGVKALIDTIHGSPDPVTLICVGPVPNIKAALEQDPSIAKKARFVGMHGSVRKGYNGGPKPSPEWNVRADVKALRAVFAAPWECTVTPLDTCGIVYIKDEKYKRILESKNPLAKALIENYKVWLPNANWAKNKYSVSTGSSTLFDTVAIYLSYAESLVEMETHKLSIDDKGFTKIDPNGNAVRCAMNWKDLGAFEDQLVERIIGAAK